jgi:hypothetical protein
MPSSNPAEIGICHPHFSALVLEDQQTNRPIQTGIGIRGDELCAERRVAENQQYRWPELDARVCCQLGLVDLGEKFDSFVTNVLFETVNCLSDGIGALHSDDAIVSGKDRR